MDTIKNSGKTLSRDEQKKIAGGGDDYDKCFTIQGSFGICKTSIECPLNLPICEAV